jgi:hypothetical protein
MTFFVPCGMVVTGLNGAPGSWFPTTTGTSYTLSPILQPLAPYRADVLVLSGLQNNACYDPNGAHATGTGGSMTAAHPKASKVSLSNGVSVDQVADAFFKGKTRFSSVQIGTTAGAASGDCDGAYSEAYNRNISWTAAGAPVAKEINPMLLFNRLFGSGSPMQTNAEAAKRRAYRLSILDAVLAQTSELKAKLGVTDQHKLDEYLTGLREVEAQVNASVPTGMQCTGTAPGTATDLPSIAKSMLDIVALAFRCDLTRAVSLMLQHGGSDDVTPYGFLGLSNSHHSYSHYRSQADLDALIKIDTWEVQQLAYLLGQLKASPDADGSSVLDNTLIYFASEISDGNDHNVDNLPVLLCGHGGGAITPGRHIAVGGAPVANVHLALLQALGTGATRFGNSTGPLAALKA